MHRLTLLSLALLGCVAATARGAEKSAPSPTSTSTTSSGEAKLTVKTVARPADADEVGVIETAMGTIVVRFYDKDAPKTVANFKKLARAGFYDGTTFHRVIRNFVIQGGDPNSKDSDPANDGQGGPGYTVPAEIKRLHKRGCLATARLPDQVNPKKESSGSQFFVCLQDLPMLDAGGYTVFGDVFEGMDVVDRIAAVRTSGPPQDRPLEPVIMKKVTIQKRSAKASAAKTP